MSELKTIFLWTAVSIVLGTVSYFLSRRRALRARARILAAPPPIPLVGLSPIVAQVSWENGGELAPGLIVERHLGAGGYGDVFLVRHTILSCSWAVKIVRRDFIADLTRRRLLLRELRTWLLIGEHPHLVRCHFFRTLGEDIAVFAEHVPGGTLSEWLGTELLSDMTAILDVALQIAWALESLHASDLVHQDVKPGNILITSRRIVKLNDFGMAAWCLADVDTVIALPGTHGYRSPEQALGHQVTAATDVWSWAVTVLAMLLGRESTHIAGEVSPRVLERALDTARGDANQNSALLLQCLRCSSLIELLRRCLRKKPAERPTMTQVAEAVESDLRRLAVPHGAAALALSPRVDGVSGRVYARPATSQRQSRLAVHQRSDGDIVSYTEQLDELLTLAKGRQDLLASVLHLAMAKAELHVAAGDVPGAAATLSYILSLNHAYPPDLAALAWFELGGACYEIGDMKGAENAFSHSAIVSDGFNLRLRARALHGLGVTLWLQDKCEMGLARVEEALILLRQHLDYCDIKYSPVGEVHTEEIIMRSTWAQMRGSEGWPEAEQCLDGGHGGQNKEAIATALLAKSRIMMARGELKAALRELDTLLSREDISTSRAPQIRVLAACACTEKAIALSRMGRARQGLEFADRAVRELHGLVASGHMDLAFELASAQVLQAYVSVCCGYTTHTDTFTPALKILEDIAGKGRQDAQALAAWARGWYSA